jgi:hypothetical protein
MKRYALPLLIAVVLCLGIAVMAWLDRPAQQQPEPEQPAAQATAQQQTPTRSVNFNNNDPDGGVVWFTNLDYELHGEVPVTKVGEASLQFPGKKIVVYPEGEKFMELLRRQGIIEQSPAATAKAVIQKWASDGILIKVPPGTRVNFAPRLHEMDMRQVFAH